VFSKTPPMFIGTPPKTRSARVAKFNKRTYALLTWETVSLGDKAYRQRGKEVERMLAELKEKQQKGAEDVEVFVDGPVDVARHVRGDRVAGPADGVPDQGDLLRGTQPAD